jgi:hypothetical protein
MDYNKESDDNINAAMTEIIFNLEGWEFNESSRVFFHCGIDGSGHYEQQVIDYCGNPADMWPIIVANDIDIISPTTSGTGLWEAYRFFPDLEICSIEFLHKNPLRAAAIVFLMMHEKEV